MEKSIPLGFFTNTFNIIFETSVGTCFIITWNNNQFLITAKHLFPNAKNGEIKNFKIRTDNGFIEFSLNINISEISGVDIAVFKLQQKVVQDIPFLLDEDIVIGGDIFFLGFPYNLNQSFTNKTNFPIPLVKKCIVSGYIHEPNGSSIMLLDGHNNPGFSGGPVGYYENSTNKMVLTSVVSGYLPQTNFTDTPLGEIKYLENSGIVITYNIKHVKEIILKNNIG
ncbi:trypsin-like peptidase [Chryseobacterium sp. 7]|uniref:S1 family peptidase n=1 Tax=Chryseobacterium sp. 7 TaxID=2035214 RepID=UPI000EAC7850|nr:serine protease [Chryseobacterium sp. 7]RLJ34171.1 trypsin-like peptidase [Chryseobacterium sp. 7]